MWSVLVLGVAAALAWRALSRANELCAIRVERGEAHLLRGRVPSRFLSDVKEIVRRETPFVGTLRVVSEGGQPRLAPGHEIPEGTAQRLRNALGQHQVLHFRAGRRGGPK